MHLRDTMLQCTSLDVSGGLMDVHVVLSRVDSGLVTLSTLVKSSAPNRHRRNRRLHFAKYPAELRVGTGLDKKNLAWLCLAYLFRDPAHGEPRPRFSESPSQKRDEWPQQTLTDNRGMPVPLITRCK